MENIYNHKDSNKMQMVLKLLMHFVFYIQFEQE